MGTIIPILGFGKSLFTSTIDYGIVIASNYNDKPVDISTFYPSRTAATHFHNKIHAIF